MNGTTQGIGPDDPNRSLLHVSPDDDGLTHLGVVGDTDTVLLRGEDTNGRFALIDMSVRPGGGPPPHRHDFEEVFTVLEGEFEVTFRGERSVVRAGETVGVPARAPHSFRNVSDREARVLCTVSPPGLEEYFGLWGVPLPDRMTPPELSDEEARARLQQAIDLGPRYAIENLTGAGRASREVGR
jgi:quercetin dioxygenase-like cupin family protein